MRSGQLSVVAYLLCLIVSGLLGQRRESKSANQFPEKHEDGLKSEMNASCSGNKSIFPNSRNTVRDIVKLCLNMRPCSDVKCDDYSNKFSSVLKEMYGISKFKILQVHERHVRNRKQGLEEVLSRKDPLLVHIILLAFDKSIDVLLSPSPKMNEPVPVTVDSKSFGAPNQTIDNVIFEAFAQNVKVVGSFYNYTFSGFLHFDNDTYTIQPLSNFVAAGHDGEKVNDLLILYRESHIEEPGANLCGKKLYQYIEAPKQTALHSNGVSNIEMHVLNDQKTHRRLSRSTNGGKSCTIHLIVDHTYFNGPGRSNIVYTLSQLRSYVYEADNIFRSTDFDGDGRGDNIGFSISNITIYTDPNDDSNKLKDISLDVYSFLERISESDFGRSCVTIAFTHRDFENGILGLAWIGSSNRFGPPGGVCEQRRFFHSINKYSTYNTAVVTSLNYGKTVSKYKTSLTLAHELGHSFGSRHDDDTCGGDAVGGQFLMHSLASDGTKPNSNKLSPCSIAGMFPVIVNKGDCFEKTSGQICGNGIVEHDNGEECDCGTEDLCEYTDPCCTPVGSSSPDPPCTFRRSRGSVCSPKVSVCCTELCQFIEIQTSKEKVCTYESDCTLESLCVETSATCSSPKHKQDDIACDGGRKHCQGGMCNVSVCEASGLLECSCEEKYNYCTLCCKAANSDKCKPASAFGILDGKGGVLAKRPGDICNDHKGFCNSNAKCVQSNYEDVFSQLGNIFSDTYADEIELWLATYWFYILIAFVVILTLFGVFVATKKKPDDTGVQAYQSSRLARLLDDAGRLKDNFCAKWIDKEKLFDEKMTKIKSGYQSVEYTEAVSRMMLLFPSVSVEILSKIIRVSANEDTAVRLLLMRGYPIRRFHITE